MKIVRGSPSSAECPRKGYACLIEKTFGKELVIPTNCKTWACLACRDRNLAAVRLKVQYGCSILKRTSLITVTYFYGGPRTLMTSLEVERHLRILFMKWREWMPNLTWFKVPELTKNLQLHLHLVVGGMNDEMQLACERKSDYGRDWRNRLCVCMEHRLSRLWHDITGRCGRSLGECPGDRGCSFVVDAVPVLSDRGAATYVGKYLVKGMAYRQELHRRGFARRWSSSRNWPRSTLKMRGSEEGRWWKTGFIGGYDAKMELAAKEDAADSLLVRVGSAEAVAFGKDVERRSQIFRLKGLAGI